MQRHTWVRGMVTLAVIGGLAGALVASPVGAAFTPTKAKIKKIAKKEATKVFNSLIGSAIANKQDVCANGTVFAFATIDGDLVTGPGFSTTGVLRQFNCAGGPIEVEDNGTGDYDVRIPGITTPAPAGEDLIAASVDVAEDTGYIASYESDAAEDFIRVVIIDWNGADQDDEFSIVIFNKP